MAAITLSKEGSFVFLIILSISALCSSIPFTNAGIKCSSLICENGGILKFVSYSLKNGFSMTLLLTKGDKKRNKKNIKFIFCILF